MILDNVAVRDRIETITDETTEMQTYERDKKSFSECQKKFTEWYRSHSRTKSKVLLSVWRLSAGIRH